VSRQKDKEEELAAFHGPETRQLSNWSGSFVFAYLLCFVIAIVIVIVITIVIDIVIAIVTVSSRITEQYGTVIRLD